MKNTTITHNSFHLGGGGGGGGGGCNLGPDMKSACCFAVPSPLSNPVVCCPTCDVPGTVMAAAAAAEGYVTDVTRKKKKEIVGTYHG